MAGNKVANGATPNPPKKRKKRTTPLEKEIKQQIASLEKELKQIASGATPKPPKKRTRRG